MPASPATTAPASRRRQLVIATVALAVASLAHGLTMPLLSLVLDHQGIDETLIGLNTGAYFVAVFAVAPFRLAAAAGSWPRPADARVDTRDGGAARPASRLPGRVAVVSAALRARDGGELPVDRGRSMGEPRGRPKRTGGRIIALFGIVVSAGFALGPLILSLTGVDGWTPFLVTIALLLPRRGGARRRPRIIPEARGTDVRAARALPGARPGRDVRLFRVRRRRRHAADLPPDLRGRGSASTRRTRSGCSP